MPADCTWRRRAGFACCLHYPSKKQARMEVTVVQRSPGGAAGGGQSPTKDSLVIRSLKHLSSSCQWAEFGCTTSRRWAATKASGSPNSHSILGLQGEQEEELYLSVCHFLPCLLRLCRIEHNSFLGSGAGVGVGEKGPSSSSSGRDV